MSDRTVTEFLGILATVKDKAESMHQALSRPDIERVPAVVLCRLVVLADGARRQLADVDASLGEHLADLERAKP